MTGKRIMEKMTTTEKEKMKGMWKTAESLAPKALIGCRASVASGKYMGRVAINLT
jgi:hypothetical protein